jgi:hypothetical protein
MDKWYLTLVRKNTCTHWDGNSPHWAKMGLDLCYKFLLGIYKQGSNPLKLSVARFLPVCYPGISLTHSLLHYYLQPQFASKIISKRIGLHFTPYPNFQW